MTEDAQPQESARHWAREIVTGHVSAIEGARRIASGADATEEGDELTVFAELVGAWEEDEAGRADCEARIMDEAGMLLADTA